jgi:hypothetical protein
MSGGIRMILTELGNWPHAIFNSQTRIEIRLASPFEVGCFNDWKNYSKKGLANASFNVLPSGRL